MIEIVSLQKVIDQNTVIDIEALKVKAGEIAAVVGGVDSGKETLLRLLTGQSRPTAGEVILAGFDPFVERDSFSSEVGVLFSEGNLYKNMSSEGNLKFFGRLHRLPKSSIEEVLKIVGLVDRANVKVENLPSKLKRRLAFGRAILHHPSVLLLVEPFANCDEPSVTLMSDLMQQLAGDGVTILIIAQDTTKLDPLCDTIYHLEKGRVVDVYRPGEEPRIGLPFMIPAKQEGKVDLVDPTDILYVVARDDRTFLQTAEEFLPTQFTLTELEKRLSRSGFFRAHRSYLVNLQHVKEVIPFTRDSFTLRLKDEAGTQIPLSKSSARELRKLLGY